MIYLEKVRSSTAEQHYHIFSAFSPHATSLLHTQAYGFLTATHQYISRKDEADKLIVCERGDLVFVWNFHPTNSYTDYRIGCYKEGQYKVSRDAVHEGQYRRLRECHQTSVDPSAPYLTLHSFHTCVSRSSSAVTRRSLAGTAT